MQRSRHESTRAGLHDWATSAFHLFSSAPCFQIYGKGRAERDFQVIDIFAVNHRNRDSRWPLFRGTCITWTANVIAVGCDFAASFLREQSHLLTTRENPLTVFGGRLNDGRRRHDAGCPWNAGVSEVMAHECGHTAQARRMGGLYWLIGGLLTQFREGTGWVHHFENQASAIGVLGGVVKGSICQKFWSTIGNRSTPPGPSPGIIEPVFGRLDDQEGFPA